MFIFLLFDCKDIICQVSVNDAPFKFSDNVNNQLGGKIEPSQHRKEKLYIHILTNNYSTVITCSSNVFMLPETLLG